MDLNAILDAVDSRLTFNANVHRYWLDKKPIPGVTTIIKAKSAPFLEKWKVRVEREACAKMAYRLRTAPDSVGEFPLTEPEFIEKFLEASGEAYEHEKQAQAAADLGSQVHALVEEKLKDQLGIPFTLMTEITDQARAIFHDSWSPWAADAQLQPLAIERRVFHEALGFAGTIDLVALVEGEPTVLDWKSKSVAQVEKLYSEPVLQSLAYRKALESLTGEPWYGRVINFPREGGGPVVVHKIKGNSNWTEEDAFEAFLCCLRIYKFNSAFDRKEKQ